MSTRQRACVLSGKQVEDKQCGNVNGRNESKICKKCQGEWGAWGTWGACLGGPICGAGKIKRSRVCLPFPGFSCSGAKVEEKACTKTCVKTWTQWGSWGTCNKPCGGGIRTRSRRCVVAGTATVVSGCQGSGSQSGVCNTGGCPIWIPGQWSPCSVTCGSGTQSRPQICVNFGTQIRATGCAAPRPATQISRCTLPGCPVWTNWGSWSPCKRCKLTRNEIVIQFRSRSCVRQGSNTPITGCSGNTRERRNCNIPICSKCLIFKYILIFLLEHLKQLN